MYRIYDNDNQSFVYGLFDTQENAEKYIKMIIEDREKNNAPYDFDVYRKCD